MKFVTIRKMGLFYNVFDDDALILHYLLHYKIIDNKVGFPSNAINKVINSLEEKNINYKILNDSQDNKDFKDLNKYDFYLAKAKDAIVVQEMIQDIELKLASKNEGQLLHILEEMERLANE